MPGDMPGPAKAVFADGADITSVQTINFLAAAYQACTYLQLGVGHGRIFFNIHMPHKVGVDPAFCFEENTFSGEGRLFFREHTDSFFARLKENADILPAVFNGASGRPAFDIIFISGLLAFEQSFRDFQNSLAFAHENTIWLLDTTVPSHLFTRLPDQDASFSMANGVWHGDAFKTVFAIHDVYPEFSYCTLMRANPQTILWRTEPSTRKQVFASLEAIAQLDYFAMLRHGVLLMPVEEPMMPHLLGLVLDPGAYGETKAWEKCKRRIASILSKPPKRS